MRKGFKGKITLIVLAVAVLLSASLVLSACGAKTDKAEMNLVDGSKPSTGEYFTEAELAAASAAAADGASDAVVKEGVAALYSAANRSRINNELSLMIQDGGGDEEAKINARMRGFTLRSGDAWYYQLPSEAIPANFANLLDMLQLAYTLDGIDYFYLRASAVSDGLEHPDCSTVTTFPYASFKLSSTYIKYTESEIKAIRNYKDSQLELCNMVMSAEYLKDDACTVSFDASTKTYTMHFELKDEAAVYEESLALIYSDGASAGMSVNGFTGDLAVWDNGYAKSFTYYQKSHTSKLGGMDVISIVAFKYFWNEDEIMSLLQEDARVSDEEKASFTTPLQYIEFYAGAPVSKAPLSLIEIIGIAVGSAAGVAIAIWVTIEILLKKGKLPALAARRARKKAKRLAKKNKGTDNAATSDGAEESSADVNAEGLTDTSDAANAENSENVDGSANSAEADGSEVNNSACGETPNGAYDGGKDNE